MKKEDRVLFKNTIMLYIMTATKYFLPFVIAACLTRRLGSSMYGELIYVSTMMGYFLSIYDFGFNYSSTKKVAESRNNSNNLSEIYSKTIYSKLILLLPSTFGFIILANSIDIIRNNIVLSVLFFINSSVHIFLPDFIYRGLEKMEYITLRYGISKIISAVLIVLFVSSSQKVILVPVFYLMGSVFAIVWSNYHLFKAYNIVLRRVEVKCIISELKESSIYFISIFASTSFSAIITFIFGFSDISTSDIAYWNIALQVVIGIQSLYDPITSSLFPRVVKEKNYRKVLEMTLFLSICVMVGCIFLFFSADFIINIIAGKEYEMASTILRYFIPLIVCSFPAQMLGFPLLGAMGKVRYVTSSTIVSALFLLVAVIILDKLSSVSIVSLAIIRGITEFIYFLQRMFYAIHFTKSCGKKEVCHARGYVS